MSFYEKSVPGGHPGCDAVEEKIIDVHSEMDGAEPERFLSGLK